MDKEINYQFTPVPTNLIYMLDSHCLHLMVALLQKYYYWKSKNKLAPDDTFYYSLNEIDDVLGNANQKDTRLTIEALFRAGLIRVESYNGRRFTTRFGINWDAIEDIEKMTLQDIKASEVFIDKLPRNSQITYTKCSTDCTPIRDTDCSTDCSTNCTPTIDNINNINNNINNIYNNIDNINNKNLNNIIKENKKENILENILGESVNSVNNGEYVSFSNLGEMSEEIGEKEEKTDSTPTPTSLNAFKGQKETILDTFSLQVEEEPTLGQECLKSSINMRYRRCGDYPPILAELGYVNEAYDSRYAM